MKTLGLIGGTGPESTIEYYRLLVAKYREQADGHSPPLIINSIDLKQMVDWMTAGELSKVADVLVVEIEKLRKAGADLAALTANTPHIVFDELQKRSSLPLISIVEAVCEEVRSRGLNNVGLFERGLRCRRLSILLSFRVPVSIWFCRTLRSRITFTRSISVNSSKTSSCPKLAHASSKSPTK